MHCSQGPGKDQPLVEAMTAAMTNLFKQYMPMSASASDSRTRDSRSPVHMTTAGIVQLLSLSHPMDVNLSIDVNLPIDVNNLSHRLASTVGLVSHLRLTADLTHVRPASRLL